MAITTHYFTSLGMRTLPIGTMKTRLVRDEKAKKYIVDEQDQRISFGKAMPLNWTNVYGEARTDHPDTALGGVICGRLTDLKPGEVEIIALDCDNQAAWDICCAMHPTYSFKFKSIGKPGGTFLYLLPDVLANTDQYSINTELKLEYMARRAGSANAMVYLPTEANETKETIDIKAKLEYPPVQVCNLLLALKPGKSIAMPKASLDKLSANLPFNAPLVKQYVQDTKQAGEAQDPAATYGLLSSPIATKVYSIFTPRKFRTCKDYQEQKVLNPNATSLLTCGSWSEYIVGVSAIAGSDPSISVELYTEFIQAITAQTEDPMPNKRLLAEVIQPMVTQSASIDGLPIWRFNEKWDKESHTIVNQYGETLEYFTLETAANRFVEYNHSNKEVIELSGIRGLRDQIYTKCVAVDSEVPSGNIVKKLKLVKITESVKLPIGVTTDSLGHSVLNLAEPVYSLQVLSNPSIFETEIDEDNRYAIAFNIFLGHLLNEDETAILFMKQVISYHGYHLTNIPIILYIIGVGGAGKSHFAFFMELLFGANTTSRPSSEQITSRFNDFLENTTCLILTETSDSAYRAQEGIKGILKTVTGERTIDIESKRQKVRRNVPIFALPILLSNEPWYKEDTADRRLFAVMPRYTLDESGAIATFEQTTGLRIIDFIEEGIRNGVIAKYLSGFRPKTLPAVPLTEDKQILSMEQKDPIMVVKNLVANSLWPRLFDKFQEHNVDLFFTAMEAKTIRDKDCLFKNQLVDLVEAMQEDETFGLTKAEISRAFTVRWMPANVVNYRPRQGNNLALKLGPVKWRFILHTAYEKWKVDQLAEDNSL